MERSTQPDRQVQQILDIWRSLSIIETAELNDLTAEADALELESLERLATTLRR